MELIKDIDELNKYLDTVFVELTNDECYCVMIGARRKYLKANEQDEYSMAGTDMLMRRIVYNKQQVSAVIRDFEQRVFVDKNGKLLPEHCLTIYITENPKSNKKASLKLAHELTERFYNGDDINLESMVKTMLHKSPSRKPYMDFDFDLNENCPIVSNVLMKNCKEILKDSTFHIVKTRGGFHLLLLKETIPVEIKNTFYKDIMGLEKLFDGVVEVKGDAMCPLPGCAQGGTFPRIKKIK